MRSNAGTGGFSLQWSGSSLIVSHVALGAGGDRWERSALVACLERAPTAVYGSVGNAL